VLRADRDVSGRTTVSSSHAFVDEVVAMIAYGRRAEIVN
jgi:hypothetical protein